MEPAPAGDFRAPGACNQPSSPTMPLVTNPSLLGGFEEFREFLPSRASSSATRPESSAINASRTTSAASRSTSSISSCSTEGAAGIEDGNDGSTTKTPACGGSRRTDRRSLPHLRPRSASHAARDLNSYPAWLIFVSATAPPSHANGPRGFQAYIPGIAVVRSYQRSWLTKDGHGCGHLRRVGLDLAMGGRQLDRLPSPAVKRSLPRRRSADGPRSRLRRPAKTRQTATDEDPAPRT